MTQTTQFPEELRRRWPDILKAAGAVGGWFDGLVGERSALMGSPGTGRRLDDEGDFPSEAPTEVPVLGEDDEWSTFQHRRMYATWCGYGQDNKEVMAWEFNFGTFSVFRVTAEQAKALNEGYEDSAGTDNERIIGDGDHAIVVYMK